MREIKQMLLKYQFPFILATFWCMTISRHEKVDLTGFRVAHSFQSVPRENLLSPQSQNNFFRINVGKIDFDERN